MFREPKGPKQISVSLSLSLFLSIFTFLFLAVIPMLAHIDC